jgi:hypothetical protein
MNGWMEGGRAASYALVKAQAVVAAQGERRHGRRGVFGGGSDGSGVDAGAVAGGGALAHEAGGAALEANRLDKGGVRLGHGIEQLRAGGGLGGGGALGHELADGVLAAADGPARGAEGADGAVAGGVGLRRREGATENVKLGWECPISRTSIHAKVSTASILSWCGSDFSSSDEASLP